MKEKHRPWVYICSPYSGDVEANIQNARRYSRYALEQGKIPITPHLLYPQFMDDEDPEERELALQICIILMRSCREVWIFGNVISEGMLKEILEATKRLKTIRWFRTDLQEVEPIGSERQESEGNGENTI